MLSADVLRLGLGRLCARKEIQEPQQKRTSNALRLKVEHGLARKVRILRVVLTLKEEHLLKLRARISKDLSQKVVKDVTLSAKECAV